MCMYTPGKEQYVQAAPKAAPLDTLYEAVDKTTGTVSKVDLTPKKKAAVKNPLAATAAPSEVVAGANLLQ